MRLRSTIAAAIASCLLAHEASAEWLHVKSYGTKDGIPAAQVLDLFQDSRGYIWLATPNGIARYDGARFTRFDVEDGLVHHTVRSIIEHDGALWFAGEKGVTRYDGERFHPMSEGVGAGIVWRAAVYAGHLWFGTSKGGLSRWDGKSFRNYTVEDGLPSNNVFSLCADGDVLWIGTLGGGLVRYDGQRFEAIGALAARHIPAIARLGDSLWIGAKDGGIFRHRGDTFERVVPDVPVYDVTVHDGELFFGMLGRGVLRMRPDGPQRFIDKRNGLTGDRVYDVLADREGSIWFSTEAGVTKLLSDKFESHLLGENVLSMVEHDGAMWLGTLGKGVVRVAADGSTRRLTQADGLRNDSAWALASGGGALWIGSGDGIDRYDGKRIEHVELRNAPAFAGIYDLLYDDGALWISTTGGICRLRDGACTTFTRANGLPADLVYTGVRHDGRTCFATEGGVACVAGDRLQVYGEADGLPSSTVYTLTVDASRSLWAGTGRGLARFDGTRFEVADKRSHGLASDYVAAVLAVNGRIYSGTDRGVDILGPKSVLTHYDELNGLASSEINYNTIVADSSGAVWFGTSSGATRYFPDKDAPSSVAPLVWIRAPKANDRELAPDTVLAPDDNNLDFEFDGLSFRDELGVRFRYRLDGFDRDWSEETSSRSVRYTNLPDGAYNFQVRARNGDGTWSDIRSIRFSVDPPYWKRWWFAGAGVLIFAGLVVLGVRVRVAQVQRKNVELAGIVRERTQQLEHANQELKALALTDPLTRLHNRRFFREMIETEVARVRRAFAGAEKSGEAPPPTGLGFLLIDIDHFKAINDQHGHEAGDALLMRVAERIRAAVRDVDWVIRWGGEEFLVVCKDTDRGRIEDLANRVGKQLADTIVLIQNAEAIGCTCSIGFSMYPFDPEQPFVFDYEAVIAFADHALYGAKRAGRNRVVGLVRGGVKLSAEQAAAVRRDVDAGCREGQLELVGLG